MGKLPALWTRRQSYVRGRQLYQSNKPKPVPRSPYFAHLVVLLWRQRWIGRSGLDSSRQRHQGRQYHALCADRVCLDQWRRGHYCHARRPGGPRHYCRCHYWSFCRQRGHHGYTFYRRRVGREQCGDYVCSRQRDNPHPHRRHWHRFRHRYHCDPKHVHKTHPHRLCGSPRRSHEHYDCGNRT